MQLNRAATALLSAAAALLPEAAIAQGQPEQAVLAFKYLDYVDLQRSGRRMHVRAPLAYVAAPLGERWGVEGSATQDSMSGASPLYYSALSGASGKGVRDLRRAGDLRLTRYLENDSVAVGTAYSDENDYTSRTVSVDARHATEDRNTTWTLGTSDTRDQIGSSNDPSLHKFRESREWLVGVTQVVSPVAIVQSNLMRIESRGYHSDPYKTLDIRPGERNAWAWLTRYNRFVPPLNGALQSSYRYFMDDWDVRAHTVEAAWHQNLPDGWALRPSVRYYTQHAASFFGAQFPPTSFDGPMSYDQRLSSFGAWSVGLKVTKVLDAHTSLDVKLENYEQRGAWSGFRKLDVPIEPFSYRLVSVGLNYRF
jgi:hypothetical protein